jgi:hypothetical protein
MSSVAMRDWIRRAMAGFPPPPAPLLESNTMSAPGNQWYPPALAGATTFVPATVGGRAVREALAVLERLTPDAYLTFVHDFYVAGLTRFGDAWHYADINTVLIGLTARLAPARYLEIGVRRGRSLAMVASQAPTCHLTASDLFVPGYAGMENPGPDTVRAELARVGFTGRLDFLIGDSAEELPRYFAAHPDEYFDVITVDGDHTRRGARTDLINVLARVKIGGALVFDDVSNRWHPELREVWDELVVGNPGFSTYTFAEVGFGVGFAVRHV